MIPEIPVLLAAVQLGLTVEPALARFLSAWFDAEARSLAAASATSAAALHAIRQAGVAAAIVAEINAAHPDWPPAQRATWAADALEQWKASPL